MFGKPHWFRPATLRWPWVPASIQGWLLAAVWSAMTLGPALLLTAYGRVPEAFIWLSAALIFGVWELRSLAQAHRLHAPAAAAAREVLVIDEQGTCSTRPAPELELASRDRLRR